MLKLESLRAFAAIAETGSFTGAAQRLMLAKSVVSERLAELERTVDAKLVHRTTRRLQLTEDGTAFYARTRLILSATEDAVSDIAHRRGKLIGPLRISGPVSFGTLHLGPALFGFMTQHPGIDITLDLDDRFVDILAEGYDVVVRHGPVDDKRVIVKRLAVCQRLLVASPAYLKKHGNPKSIEELTQHRGIIYSNRGAADWRFQTGRRFATVRPATAFHVNNGLVMRDAAAAGLGIALLPTFLFKSTSGKRALKTIDVGAQAEGATIYMAYPEHLRTSGKIRALTSWLQQQFGDPAYWNATEIRRARSRR